LKVCQLVTHTKIDYKQKQSKENMKYFLDTCIWRDFYENRFSKRGAHLGEFASKLFKKIIKEKSKIIFSKSIIKELSIDYNSNDINNMLNLLIYANVLERIEIKEEEYKEAKKISAERKLPFIDVLNAIQARNHNAILVSQDKHFAKLSDIIKFKRPQELI